ncbi:uncharacterized protein RAG0_16328 [Rhynchosporium agropyri]|uniref:Uncharacterized protein n=1 Tax=Rhynchosporium agropyri TaxID=914238 RepID=A0A1E1LPW8_9HELO|nr:uncharacterized protein RAG0_16328 [Rhynchosporium agropyri]
MSSHFWWLGSLLMTMRTQIREHGIHVNWKEMGHHWDALYLHCVDRRYFGGGVDTTDAGAWYTVAHFQSGVK